MDCLQKSRGEVDVASPSDNHCWHGHRRMQLREAIVCAGLFTM